jgi:hypothetical protein
MVGLRPLFFPYVAVQDIEPGWDNVVKLLEYNVGLSRFAGPDRGWNDLDSEWCAACHALRLHCYVGVRNDVGSVPASW